MAARKAIPLLGLLLARPSVAETTEPPSYARVAVGVSGNLGAAFGDSCQAAVSDMVQCGSVTPLAGLRLMPRWRGGEHWAAGLSGGLVRHVADRDGPTDWWDAEAEARWYPLGARRFDLWLGATGGVVLAIDRVPAHTPEPQLGVMHPRQTFHTVGPSAGLGIGFDSVLVPWLALGPELRGFVLGLDSGPVNMSRPLYRAQLGFTLGVTLTVLAVPSR